LSEAVAAGGSVSATPVTDALRDDPPNLHGAGQAYFGLQWDALRWLERTVQPGWTTLETGCGGSTVVFAARGARHLAITPAADEHDAVRAYCAARAIPTAGLSFLAAPSDEALLRDWTPEPLDLVLVDGAHGFPFPALDWYLTARHLRRGGFVVLDDAFLPSVHVVVRFLRSSSSWRMEAPLGYRTVAFRKVADELSYDWVGSRFDRMPRFDYLPPAQRVAAYGRTFLLDRSPRLMAALGRVRR
jgi:predicted O-methyltransferase YrrM